MDSAHARSSHAVHTHCEAWSLFEACRHVARTQVAQDGESLLGHAVFAIPQHTTRCAHRTPSSLHIAPHILQVVPWAVCTFDAFWHLLGERGRGASLRVMYGSKITCSLKASGIIGLQSAMQDAEGRVGTAQCAMRHVPRVRYARSMVCSVRSAMCDVQSPQCVVCKIYSAVFGPLCAACPPRSTGKGFGGSDCPIFE